MGQNNQGQPGAGVAPPTVPAGAAPPPGVPPSAPPVPGQTGMTQEQKMALIAQLLPAAAQPAMRALALRQSQKQQLQTPPGTPGYGDAPTLNPSVVQA